MEILLFLIKSGVSKPPEAFICILRQYCGTASRYRSQITRGIVKSHSEMGIDMIDLNTSEAKNME